MLKVVETTLTLHLLSVVAMAPNATFWLSFFVSSLPSPKYFSAWTLNSSSLKHQHSSPKFSHGVSR